MTTSGSATTSGSTSTGRLVVFLAGSAVLPWLGASLTTLAFWWAAEDLEDAVHGLVTAQHALQPLTVLAVLAGFLQTRGTARLRPVFKEPWAVGGLVATVSAVTAMVLGLVFARGWGLVMGTAWSLYSGYVLFAVLVGADLWRRCAPTKDSVMPQARYENLP